MTNTTPSPHSIQMQNGLLVDQLSESTRRRLLADERRRQVLTALDDDPARTGLHELARAIVNESGDAPTESRVDDIAIELHHHHLPKLNELPGFEYDHCSKEVRYRGNHEQ